MEKSTFNKNMTSTDTKMDSSPEFNDLASQIQNDGLALKLFKDQCCESCSCQSDSDHK